MEKLWTYIKAWTTKKNYTTIFKKILVNHEGFQKLTLVILEALAPPHHSNKIVNYIKFISLSWDAKFKYEHGDSPCVIKINVSSIRFVKEINFLLISCPLDNL